MDKKFNYKFGGGAEKFYTAINPDITTTNKNVLYFNSDSRLEDNAYPAKLIDLYVNGSSVHSNYINLKRNLTYGEGLRPTEASAEWAAFMDTYNKAGDDGNDIFLKMCLDFALFEAATVQVIYNSEGQIASWYHVDTSDVRAEKPDEFGRVNNWYVSKYWADISNKKNSRATEKNKAVKLPSFNPSTGVEDGVQLLYIRRYVSGSQVYAIPMYNSAINWIQLDHELSKFELNKVAKGFFPSGILYLTGDPDDEQKAQFKNQFERKYVGSDKEKLLYVWGTNADEKPEFIRTEADKNDVLFNDLNEISTRKISVGHGSPSVELAAGDSGGASLGGDANKLNVALAYYQKNVIRPMQEVLIAGINKIMKVNDLPEVEIDYQPLDVEISSDTEEQPTVDETTPEVEETVAVTSDKNKIAELNVN